ncbi:hypothetical protein HMPREF9075_00221 [Capnocytophaga sp. oral taxon 332 str. F0381]|uniref:hypothetical protein n=1 Tax=Capnocytophaga sp. oral taxon 332 TaxID=712213 RepID=UPI0002A2FD02|nr:hypothetical protein [Capnocytophaga sp. oral taxon 332]EKY12917.1 hypothetical protein HMPREF9075_00221 [Capnocytophaga sp. oral taxon 332 str. F0381]
MKKYIGIYLCVLVIVGTALYVLADQCINLWGIGLYYPAITIGLLHTGLSLVAMLIVFATFYFFRVYTAFGFVVGLLLQTIGISIAEIPLSKALHPEINPIYELAFMGGGTFVLILVQAVISVLMINDKKIKELTKS